ncbi:hypothetical protein SNE40_011875 [Patella caerulea]|uniref:Uncharacterized protein n=1 Tax=Patella caerulea TaxID=87958 RepID=A0AAN8JP83_PATCE
MEATEIASLRKRIQYTRPRGITLQLNKLRQSELKQLTVTRVAADDATCQRRVKIYHTDMSLNIKHISKQQKLLRRSMRHYTKTLRHNKKDREKREQELKQKSQLTVPNVLTLDVITEETEVDSREKDTEPGGENESTKECLEISIDINQNSTEIKDSSDSIIDDPICDNTEQSPMINLTKNLQNERSQHSNNGPKLNDMGVIFYSKKKQKRLKAAVCYSDLVKLQHSTNTRQLFKLVDQLAKLHGVTERGVAPEKDIKEPIEPLRRNSLYYTINYGYDVPEESASVSIPNVQQDKSSSERIQDPNNSSVTESSPAYNRIFSVADNEFWREVHRARVLGNCSPLHPTLSETDDMGESKSTRRRRRRSDLPLLVADYSAIKSRALLADGSDKLSSQKKIVSTKSSQYYRQHHNRLPPLTKGLKTK